MWDLCLPFSPVTGLALPPPFAWCVAPTHTPLIPSFVTSLGFFRRSSWRAGRPRASCESDPISKLLYFVVLCFAVVGSLQVAAWTGERTDGQMCGSVRCVGDGGGPLTVSPSFPRDDDDTPSVGILFYFYLFQFIYVFDLAVSPHMCAVGDCTVPSSRYMITTALQLPQYMPITHYQANRDLMPPHQATCHIGCCKARMKKLGR